MPEDSIVQTIEKKPANMAGGLENLKLALIYHQFCTRKLHSNLRA